jgi:hypothetical protein
LARRRGPPVRSTGGVRKARARVEDVLVDVLVDRNPLVGAEWTTAVE